MPTNSDPSPESFDDSTLPTPKDLPSSHQADEFATVIPVNGIDDATFVPPVDADATYVPIGNLSSQVSVESRVRYFGDYELICEIARGGMGVVYKARQTNLNRVVALKMILAGQFASEEDVQRFRTEAEAAANLDHPGIVPIYEIGQHEGQHFFSMGYVDGCSLADRVRNGPLPPKEAAELTKKIAESIAFAHSRNVIHRDLKPANVLLDQNREPKVTDFGLARKTDDDSGMTRTGAVMGTPSYMPPEQAAGKTAEVGPLSDVYSLGAILYCLLTGRPPFQAANPMDTLLQVMEREPVSVSTINPEIQRDLETICQKCLQKETGKRYASAQELAEDLGRWLRGEPIQARAVSNAERAYRWVRRNPVVSGLAAATLAAIMIGGIASLSFGLWALDEAQKSKVAESKATEASNFSRVSEIQARHAENRAKQSAADAIAARDTAEATLARFNYFLAMDRWSQGRNFEAKELLEKVPRKYRNFEWRLAKREFDGADLLSVTLEESASEVNCVAFSSDVTRILSGADNKTVKMWDATTGKELRTFRGHESGVYSVTFSPDGARVASASGDKTIKLWDAATGVELATLSGHKSGVSIVSFGPDGNSIASGSFLEIKLWETMTGKELCTLTGHEDGITTLKFSPNGTCLASGSADKTVRMWDTSTGETLRKLEGHEDTISSVSFSPDGMLIASGSYDASIKVWSTATGEEYKELKGHDNGVVSVCFSEDGTRIVSGSVDGTIKVWDFVTGEELHAFQWLGATIKSVSITADGTRIGSWSGENTIKHWNLESWEERRTFDGLTSNSCVAFSPDGGRITSGGYDGVVRLWDAATGEELLSLDQNKPGVDGEVNAVTLSPDGTRIAAGGGEYRKPQQVKIWDATTGQELHTLNGHEYQVNSVAFSRDGTKIVSAGGDNSKAGQIKIWDVATGEELLTFNQPESAILSVSFDPDGTRIVSCAGEWHMAKEIKLWDAASGEPLFTLDMHGEQVTSVSFSPDGTRIVAGGGKGDAGQIKIWDAATGQELHTLNGREYIVTSVSFSPDGTRIVSAAGEGDAGQIQIWDVMSGEELRTLKVKGNPEAPVSFIMEGTRIAALTIGGVLNLWNTATHEEQPNTLEFEPLTNQGRPEREIAFRRYLAAPKPHWHAEQAEKFEDSSDLFAAVFHRAWLLKIAPSDAWRHDDLHKDHQQYVALHAGRMPPMPAVATEMLPFPRGTKFPQVNDEFAKAFVGQIWTNIYPAIGDSGTITSQDLQRLRDICQMRPTGYHFMILGITEYRVGQFDAAVGSLTVATDRLTSEWALPEPHPLTLGFLAMCHHQLGHKDEASRFLDQMRVTLKDVRYAFDASTQQLTQEAIRLLNGADAFPELSAPVQFAQEATFENLVSHHWKIATWRNRPEQVSLSKDVIHEGTTALQIQVTQEADDVTLYQAVALEPNQKYRLTGWIKTDNVTVDPMETGTTGACLTIYGQTEISESVLGTSDWKQVAVEFTSNESSTLNIGCRLGHNGSTCTGTAWFDDLKLEKVE